MTAHDSNHPVHPNLSDLYHKLGVVEGKIDGFLEGNKRVEAELRDISGRVSSLETLKWKIVGGVTAVSVGLSAIVSSLDTWMLRR